jgi:hypothetical protein
VTELFYIIADTDCAAARKAAMADGVREKVSFRNLDYPEVAADFAARGGTHLPAIWDGERLHEGLPAVLEGLTRLRAG